MFLPKTPVCPFSCSQLRVLGRLNHFVLQAPFSHAHGHPAAVGFCHPLLGIYFPTGSLHAFKEAPLLAPRKCKHLYHLSTRNSTCYLILMEAMSRRRLHILGIFLLYTHTRKWAPGSEANSPSCGAKGTGIKRHSGKVGAPRLQLSQEPCNVGLTLSPYRETGLKHESNPGPPNSNSAASL